MTVIAGMFLVLVVVVVFTVTASVVMVTASPGQVTKLSFPEEPGLPRSI